MTPETIFIFFMSLLLLWLKPGPGQAFKLATLFNDGFLSAYFVVFGIISACLVFFFVAVFGYGALTSLFEQAGIFLKVFGVIYLAYIGIKGLLNTQKGLWREGAHKSKKRKFLEHYPAGLFLTLANPLPIIYFLSILPVLVPVGGLEKEGVIVGALMIIAAGLLVDTLLLVLASQIKALLSSEKVVRWLNIFTSMSFLLIALFILYSLFFSQEIKFDI